MKRFNRLTRRYSFVPGVFFSLAALIAFLPGCGYSTSSTLPSNIKTIHVELFENKVDYAISAAERRSLYVPLLEVKVRKAIIDRFLFDGNLRIANPDKADLVMRGKLLNYDRSALRYDDNNDVQEYRIHITVSLELWNNQQQAADWTESGFVGEATYFLSGPLASTENAAIDEAVVDLARRIVERTIEDW